MSRVTPLANADQLIMIALLRRGEAGAARLRDEIEAFAGYRMPRGRLYARLELLEDAGMVRRAGSADDWPRRFRATAKGRAEIRALRTHIKEFLRAMPRGL